MLPQIYFSEFSIHALWSVIRFVCRDLVVVYASLVLVLPVEEQMASMESVERVCHVPLVTSVLVVLTTLSPVMMMTWTWIAGIGWGWKH